MLKSDLDSQNFSEMVTDNFCRDVMQKFYERLARDCVEKENRIIQEKLDDLGLTLDDVYVDFGPNILRGEEVDRLFDGNAMILRRKDDHMALLVMKWKPPRHEEDKGQSKMAVDLQVWDRTEKKQNDKER